MNLTDFAQAAIQPLRNGQAPSQRLLAWQTVIELTEQAVSSGKINTDGVACSAGCGDCCTINVNILEPEALAIAGYVDKYFLPEDKVALLNRLVTLHRETRWLDDEERMMVRKSCAFLNAQQLCTVHSVRPLLCRSLTSTDPVSCREAINMLALGEPPLIICNLQHKKLYEHAYLGLAAALRECNLDHASYRLTGKALEVLHD